MDSRRRSRSLQASRRNRHRSRSSSPPRRRRYTSSPNSSPKPRHRESPPRRRRRSPDANPPRRKRRSPSPSDPRETRRRSFSRSPPRRDRNRKPLPPQEASYRSQQGNGDTSTVDKPVEKQKPNWKPTGLLAAETNKVTIGDGSKAQDVILKYHEPSEARKPPTSEAWVMYVFDEGSKDPTHTVPLHSRSCWLLGRETAVTDIPLEHKSCSKQHAVFQFRYTTKTNEYGEKKSKVGLYLLDLESSNGTFLNDDKIEVSRYVQCLSGDVVKFGDSKQEYVVLLPPKE